MKLEILTNEMITAMKNKDKIRKDTVSSLIQAIKKFGIDNRCKDNVTEDQINAVILKEKKILQEMIDTCPADRVITLQEYKNKMTIINEFAPTLMNTRDEILNYIKKLNIEITKENRGKIMKELKGKADMKIANDILKDFIK